MEKLIAQFKKQFNRNDYKVIFSPYRICPLGAHVDHQLGLITGFTIDHGIHLVYAPNDDGYINLQSGNFPDNEKFHLRNIIPYVPGFWGNYIRGAILALSKNYVLKKGITGIAHGSLPIGGLSSSAAVSSAYVMALADVNHIQLSPLEVINLVADIEHEYIGLKNGILDQSVNVLSKNNHLLYMDTKTNDYKLIKKNESMPEFEVIVVYSGITKALIATDYNQRVNECRASAWYLKALEDKEITTFNQTHLRDLEPQIFEKHKDSLPGIFKKRAEHFYTENERVEQGVKAWENGDLKTFGKLVFESGDSSVYNYESGSPELIHLFNILRDTEGIFGARFSGAGYRGCVIGLVDPIHKDEITKKITKSYLEKYPEYTNVFQIDYCKMDDGARIL